MGDHPTCCVCPERAQNFIRGCNHGYCEEHIMLLFDLDNISRFSCKDCQAHIQEVGASTSSSTQKCHMCQTQEATVNLPCPHRFCRECYTGNMSTILAQFRNWLANGATNVPSWSLGCPEQCVESTCFFPAEYFADYFPNFPQNDRDTLARYYPFFNGVNCKFVQCCACNQATVVFSQLQRDCIICRQPYR